MQNKILITLLAIVLCTACKKNTTIEEPPKVYTPTQTGENILYCKINGAERIYDGKKSLFGVNDEVDILTPHFPDSSGAGIKIIADDIEGDYDYITLYVDMSYELGGKIGEVIPDLNKTYKLSNHFPFEKSTYRNDKLYIIDSTVSTLIFTRFDDDVASGTFYFEAYSEDNNKVMATEGFFDIKRD